MAEESERREMNTLAVMDHTGHMEVRWDPSKQEEVEQARKTFMEMKKKGYAAYRTKEGGKTGELVKEFDPKAESIVMRAPMAGG